mmetsp:Transcript_17075/g.47662  ORF Transcript_17075/g.47662 Transcript_17075/m.47662 type:complete len:834 (-) Transcript_17075:392-2893(-)
MADFGAQLDGAEDMDVSELWPPTPAASVLPGKGMCRTDSAFKAGLGRTDSAYEAFFSRKTCSPRSSKGKIVAVPARLSVAVYAGWMPELDQQGQPGDESIEVDQSMEGGISHRYEASNTCCWQRLPDSLIGSILQLLDSVDVAAVRCVCKYWHDSGTSAVVSLKPQALNIEGLASRFPRLKSLDLSNVTEQITTQRLAALGTSLSGLSILNLGRHHRMIVSHVTDEGLGALAGLTRLSTLNLAQCVHITDRGLCLVADNMPSLAHLNISGCVQVTDVGLSHLPRLRHLEVLEIPWCLKVTDNGLAALRPLHSTLRSLNISGCQLVTEAGVSILRDFTLLTQLTLLHLGYANPAVTDTTLSSLCTLSQISNLSLSGLQLNTIRVTDHGVRCIVSSFPMLTQLNLMWLNITDAGCALLSGIPALRSLSLRGCHCITAAGVAHLAVLTQLELLNLLNLPEFDVTDAALQSLTPLTRLKSLGLGDTHVGNNVTDKGMVALAGFPHLESLSLWWMHWNPSDLGLVPLPALTRLTSLDLQGCINVRDASLVALAGLTQLSNLQLCRCTKVTDSGLRAIRHLTGLTNLNLCSCYRITDTGMHSVAHLTSMEVLILDGCYELTDAGICMLAPLTNLQTLNVSCCERVTGTGFPAMCGLSQLTSLNLSCCSYLKEQGLQAVASFPSLTKLDLCQCLEVGDTGLSYLSPLTGLTGLDLAYCPKVSDMGLKALAGLSALTTLKLNGCSAITDIGLEHIRPLSRLLTIHLDRCYRVTDAGLVSLAGLTGLTSLRLAHCHQLTDVGVQSLANLTRLSTLSLAFCTTITDEGMRALSSLTALASLEL